VPINLRTGDDFLHFTQGSERLGLAVMLWNSSMIEPHFVHSYSYVGMVVKFKIQNSKSKKLAAPQALNSLRARTNKE
jgi:hypothetical protein